MTRRNARHAVNLEKGVAGTFFILKSVERQLPGLQAQISASS